MVPEADAKLQATGVLLGDENKARGDQVLTQVFLLRHENANNLVAVLRPLVNVNNTINANPGNNSLVITDYADNLQRIAKIIAALDTPSSHRRGSGAPAAPSGQRHWPRWCSASMAVPAALPGQMRHWAAPTPCWPIRAATPSSCARPNAGTPGRA